MTPQSTGLSTTAGSSPSLQSFRSQAATREGSYLIQSDMALALSHVHFLRMPVAAFGPAEDVLACLMSQRWHPGVMDVAQPSSPACSPS